MGSSSRIKHFIKSSERFKHFPNQMLLNRNYFVQKVDGVLFAYSVTRLNAFVDRCVKVRRSSDNTTLDVGFVNDLIDSTSLLSFCSGTDGFVDTWYDQSGNGYHQTQATLANQPRIVTAGAFTSIDADLPLVVFNGVNDFMQNTSVVCPSTSVFCGVSIIKPSSVNANQVYMSGNGAFVIHQQFASDFYVQVTLGNHGRFSQPAFELGTYCSVFDGNLSGNINRLKVWRISQQTLIFTGTIPTTVTGTGLELGRLYAGGVYANGGMRTMLGILKQVTDPTTEIIPFI